MDIIKSLRSYKKRCQQVLLQQEAYDKICIEDVQTPSGVELCLRVDKITIAVISDKTTSSHVLSLADAKELLEFIRNSYQGKDIMNWKESQIKA